MRHVVSLKLPSAKGAQVTEVHSYKQHAELSMCLLAEKSLRTYLLSRLSL